MLDRATRIIGNYILDRIREEFVQQGHNLSGDFGRSLEYTVRETAAGLVISFLGNDYGEYVNRFLPAQKVPYTPGGPKRGGKSQYIQGLIRYVERRMALRGKEAVSVAFAIARKHAKEGRPTRGSYRFSRNGRRFAFVEEVIEKDETIRFIQEAVQTEFEVLIQNFVTQNALAA